MKQATIRQTVTWVREQLEEQNYAEGTLLQFKNTTNQLLKFMDSEQIEQYTTDVGIRFLQACYAYDPKAPINDTNAERLRYLRKLSEYQLHGTIFPKPHRRERHYDTQEGFRAATDAFLAYRRFEGIVERNMSTITLYLERFFSYLTAHAVTLPEQITGIQIHGFYGSLSDIPIRAGTI